MKCIKIKIFLQPANLLSRYEEAVKGSDNNLTVVRICCESNFLFINETCIKINDSEKYNDSHKINFPKIFNEKLSLSKNKTENDYIKIYELPCDFGIFYLFPDEEELYFLENATIFTNLTEPPFITSDEFC